MNNELKNKGQLAKEAAYALSNASTGLKDDALYAIADGLEKDCAAILDKNQIDLKRAEERGTSKAMLDRLRLDEGRISAIADGVRQVAALADPVGEVISMWKRPNGLTIGQKRVPLGVIGIIYESRPNVTADAAAKQ